MQISSEMFPHSSNSRQGSYYLWAPSKLWLNSLFTGMLVLYVTFQTRLQPRRSGRAGTCHSYLRPPKSFSYSSSYRILSSHLVWGTVCSQLTAFMGLLLQNHSSGMPSGKVSSSQFSLATIKFKVNLGNLVRVSLKRRRPTVQLVMELQPSMYKAISSIPTIVRVNKLKKKKKHSPNSFLSSFKTRLM